MIVKELNITLELSKNPAQEIANALSLVLNSYPDPMTKAVILEAVGKGVNEALNQLKGVDAKPTSIELQTGVNKA